MEMSFVAAFGKLNVDLLYSGMPRIPDEGEEPNALIMAYFQER